MSNNEFKQASQDPVNSIHIAPTHSEHSWQKQNDLHGKERIVKQSQNVTINQKKRTIIIPSDNVTPVGAFQGSTVYTRHCASMAKTTRMAFAICTDKRRTFVVMKEQAMMDDASHKAGRIEIRLTAQDKALFKRAQVLSGDKSVSSFILRIVKNHAQKLIAENDRILVSERDQAVFFEANKELP